MQTVPPNLTSRLIICAAIVLITLLLVFPLCMRMTGGIYYLEALNNIRDGHFGVSLNNLKKTIEYLDKESFVHNELGEVYYKLSVLKRTAHEAFSQVIKSKEHFTAAADLNPIDAETAYNAARSEFRLKMIENVLYPGKDVSEYEPEIYYRRAISLRPNSVTYRYGMIKYLAHMDRKDELISGCGELVRIYPGSYNYLRKESFWNNDFINPVEKGLLKAVEEGYSAKEALKALSALYMDQSRWTDAISCLEKTLAYRSYENKASDLLQMGNLYLLKNDTGKAAEYFMKGLKRSTSRDNHFRTIHNYYRNAGRLDLIKDLYEEGSGTFTESPGINLIYARALIELGELEHARELLIALNRDESNHEAYYLLSKLAEKEKDWDSMELMIQKATVLDPENSLYHYTFSNVLRRLKKFERAEKEATLAIKFRKNSSSSWYNYRAGLRLSLKDYKGAAADWRNAISLKPGNASFYAQAAEAYLKQNLLPIAVDYYKRALDLQPGNDRYRKRYEELQAMI
jgi:tetratricopeptide (TPR) repeat protein